jgi:hypothetical protein
MAFLAVALAAASCKGQPDDTPWCSDTAASAPGPLQSSSATYYQDAQPIIAEKCAWCHRDGGIAPFALETYEQVFERRAAVATAVRHHVMPPWLAARCCTDYFRDYSLTETEIATVLGWLENGASAGDSATAAPVPEPVGGLSRVDVTLQLPEPYTPQPGARSTDDTRCFALDWPLDEVGYVTGLNPLPDKRQLVHHLIVGVLGPDDADQVPRDGGGDADGPGFRCGGGVAEFENIRLIGGSLLGGDFPRGIGARVEPGSKILLNIHYSTDHAAPEPDQTAIQFRVDATARESKASIITNLAWAIGDAMLIPAGEKDAVFFYRYRPDLFTRGRAVKLQNVTPHMHYFGSRLVVRKITAEGKRECLLEIPRWDFGWEQPFWFAEEKQLNPGDELYLECHFDNSAENQPHGHAPRDIAWGENNQDMCAAFVAFTEIP